MPRVAVVALAVKVAEVLRIDARRGRTYVNVGRRRRRDPRLVHDPMTVPYTAVEVAFARRHEVPVVSSELQRTGDGALEQLRQPCTRRGGKRRAGEIDVR